MFTVMIKLKVELGVKTSITVGFVLSPVVRSAWGNGVSELSGNLPSLMEDR